MAFKGRAALFYLAVLSIFGVWLPRQKGATFFDPLLFVPFSCLAWVFAAPQIPDAFAQAARRDRAWLTRQILTAILISWLANVILVVTSVMVVNRMYDEGFMPRTDLLIAGPLLGLGGATLLAGAGTWMGLNGWKPDWIRLILRLILLMFLFGYALAIELVPHLLLRRLQPPILLASAGILFAAGLIFSAAALRSRRT